MRSGWLGSVRRSWLLTAVTAIFICLLMVYFGAFLVIRHRANFDYELMLQGERPRYTHGEPLYVENGGSRVYVGFGYEACRVNRDVTPPWPGSNYGECLTGTQLVFTCRRFFPGLESHLEDRDDTGLVVVPVRRGRETAPDS